MVQQVLFVNHFFLYALNTAINKVHEHPLVSVHTILDGKMYCNNLFDENVSICPIEYWYLENQKNLYNKSKIKKMIYGDCAIFITINLSAIRCFFYHCSTFANVKLYVHRDREVHLGVVLCFCYTDCLNHTNIPYCDTFSKVMPSYIIRVKLSIINNYTIIIL